MGQRWEKRVAPMSDDCHRGVRTHIWGGHAGDLLLLPLRRGPGRNEPRVKFPLVFTHAAWNAVAVTERGVGSPVEHSHKQNTHLHTHAHRHTQQRRSDCTFRTRFRLSTGRPPEDVWARMLRFPVKKIRKQFKLLLLLVLLTSAVWFTYLHINQGKTIKLHFNYGKGKRSPLSVRLSPPVPVVAAWWMRHNSLQRHLKGRLTASFMNTVAIPQETTL